MSQDLVKEAFKTYKSKTADLSRLIRIENGSPQLVPRRADTSELDPELSIFLTTPWQTFDVSSCPGLIVVKNPFTSFGQQYLVTRCLRDYPLPPNPTNLATKNVSDEVKANWWRELEKSSMDGHVKSALRWTTLGFHHDWDSKVYHEDARNEFPPDLAKLTREIAKALGFPKFAPEAAIVNYYLMNSTLAGHTDHSEYCNEPLFSISLGQSAIFLIGGRTREEPVEAILLESGDIVVMTGKSRESFHAVPRILPASCEPWKGATALKYLPEPFESSVVGENWEPFEAFLGSSRININIRQVYGNKS